MFEYANFLSNYMAYIQFRIYESFEIVRIPDISLKLNNLITQSKFEDVQILSRFDIRDLQRIQRY